MPKLAVATYLPLNIDRTVTPGLQGWMNLADAGAIDYKHSIPNLRFVRSNDLPAAGPGISVNDRMMLEQWMERNYQWMSAFAPLREADRRADAADSILDFFRQAAARVRIQQRAGTPNQNLNKAAPYFDTRVQLVDMLLGLTKRWGVEMPLHLLDDGAEGEEPTRAGGPRVGFMDLVLGTFITKKKVTFYNRNQALNLLGGLFERKSNIIRSVNVGTSWEKRRLLFKATGNAKSGGGGRTQSRKYRTSRRDWGYSTAAASRSSEKKQVEGITLLGFMTIIIESVVQSPLTYVVIALMAGLWLILRTITGRSAI